MSLATVMHSVWALGLVLQAVLTGVLLVKGTWKTFPVFTSYTVFSLLESGVAYAVFKNQSVYFWTYVTGESVLMVLGLALVREIFTNLFSAHAGLRKMATLIFRFVVVLLVLLAVIVIHVKSPLGRGGLGTIGRASIGAALPIVEEACRILQVGLIMFLFLFSSAFGLRWRQHVFGVALGLGMTTVGELLAVTMMPHVNKAMAWRLDLAHIAAFDLALLVWMGYLIAPEPAPRKAEVPKAAQLEQWNQAVMELISR
jgi:hypothetical protein